MNYNSWFYDQHKYRTGIRNGQVSFNDTKWVNMNDRYRILKDMNSRLLKQQPFGVVGNNTGFDKLIDLLGRSNYTFEDINESLIDTYKASLQNAMSRNLVNTHAVMFHCSSTDSKNVSHDKFTHYWIIDAPFNQLHFGDRDEFIRQKLNQMHNTTSGTYVDMYSLTTAEFTKILGFTMICTVNGYICNDCKVAIDDKGFKFKVGWPYSSDVEFIIYKLDECAVYHREIPVSSIYNENIPYSVLGDVSDNMIGCKCIINVYDKKFSKTSPTVPNFGIFTETGLNIKNIQRKTIQTAERYNTTNISLDIYVIKHLHEVPNIYPAINYYDIIDSRRVYTERHENVSNTDGERIVASSTRNINNLEICTPPITLDRDVRYSFTTITSCLYMHEQLMMYESDIKIIGGHLINSSWTEKDFINTDVPKLNTIYTGLLSLYKTYQHGAIITSLVSDMSMDKFTKLIQNIKNLKDVTDYSDIQKYTFDELYESNYKATVNIITAPFRDNALSNFAKMKPISDNYFVSDNSTRFNRPVAEQNFITLRYHDDDECWLFDYPEIKHFHGIGNTFYIDSNLKGDEIFKFFVLYSDTEDPSEKDIDHFDINTIFDFDKFSSEVEKHIGCIRYWDAENRLMKISKTLYDRYDDETCIHVFSKILKRKISGDNILRIYPSDINYEASNITSDNWDNYNEDSERSPFTINFLFYTLAMLNDNEDKLQAYFYNQLTNKKYDNRYSDINIESVLDDEKYPIRYSGYTLAPDRLSSTYEKPLSLTSVYYGLPLILAPNSSNLYKPHRYVFNVYDPEIKYPLIDNNDVNKTYYVQYDDITRYGGRNISYTQDICVCQEATLYLSSIYDYISTLQTNYKTSYNQTSCIESAINTVNKHIETLNSFIQTMSFDMIRNNDTIFIINEITIDNKFIKYMNDLQSLINQILLINFNGKNISIIEFINKLITSLRHVYITSGFDNYITKHARMLYINLKKINTPMNLYEYKKWINDIDLYVLKNLDTMLAKNNNYSVGENTFRKYWESIDQYVHSVVSIIELLDSKIKNLSTDLMESHINPITSYCDYIINNFIYDLYISQDVEYDSSIKYSTKPAYIMIGIPGDEHIYSKNDTISDEMSYLVYQPIVDQDGSDYVISSISNVCEYVFFNGESLNGLTMTVLDIQGNVITSQTVSLSFMRVGSTADRINGFDQLMNMRSTTLDFENTHESFEVVNGLIVNEKHADMNYELLIGNRFDQLHHETEYVLQPDTWLQGSVDRVFLSNQYINRMIAYNISHKTCHNMFFKPVQVLHIECNEDGSIDSIAGKYFEGQTIYLSTVDGLTIFPVIITAIDHSMNKGFIEARVDSWNSKWFNINDQETITKYLTSNIECKVIDDNIRNFIDEYNNPNYVSYSNPSYNTSHDEMNTVYELPGDPLFVSNNTNFVYTRLNWIFNDLIPNNTIDEIHKTHKFMYITSGFINNDSDILKINMINYNFNTLTNPEKYPILRSEPNDHSVWNEEIRVFKQKQYEALNAKENVRRYQALAENSLTNAVSVYDREYWLEKIDSYDREIQKYDDLIKRMDLYIKQLETPTTWFNVRAYEDTLVYIANGRVDQFSPEIISNIRDLQYSDKLDVFLYDWEHKMWLDPSTYNVSMQMIDNIKIDEHDDYSTNRVLHTITIQPLDGFNFSKKILVYFSYNKSDIFEDIELNPDTCFVKFKPLLSLDKDINDYNPYSDIKIRKHFDGFEKYKFDQSEITDGVHIKRVKRSGKYTYSPTFRVCDITFTDNNGDHTYEDINEFFIPAPFTDITTSKSLHKQIFETTIDVDIDSFVPNTNIKLICISNDKNSSYDGNISNVMFNAMTTLDGIEILDSTLPNYVSGTFICTVFKDDMYKPCGGIITVEVSSDTEDIYNDKWVRIPKDYLKYRELPDEFMFTVNDPTTEGGIVVTLKNQYEKSSDDNILNDNTGLYNPYEYYYDTKNKLRLPISDVRINSHKQRLVINKDINTNIKLIKSTYIGICRYSTQRIPKDGLIDLTGYIPTPLSRDRYEFWINGRCITDKNDLIILSPTSIQLCNMKSLKNFEVIELVDDVDADNVLFDEGNVYIDMNGNSYSSYRLALLSNTKIRNQNVMFTFNANNHKPIHDYTSSIIGNPNNQDLEDDILSVLAIDNTDMDYNKLYNIPSINGISLFHPSITSLGISEIPNEKIIDEFDKVWKYEILTNPLFTTTHRDSIGLNDNIDNILHVKQITDQHWNGLSIDTRNMFVIHASGMSDKYFSLYISKTSDGKIDDITNTVKIIPFISQGVSVLIDADYKGLWLHSTHPNTKPIRIIN